MVYSRRDLSAYLVHLTRNFQGSPAKENLISVLEGGVIEARTPLGIAVRHLESLGYTEKMLASQRVACFSETPLDDLHGLIDPGIWRANNFQPYGVVFKRETLISKGANPVWYLNTFSGSGLTFRWLAHSVNSMIDDVAIGPDGNSTPERFAGSEVAKLTPFIETIGRWGTKVKDFSFEREWRHCGDFTFSPGDCVEILTPPEEQAVIREQLLERGYSAKLLSEDKFRSLREADVIGL